MQVSDDVERDPFLSLDLDETREQNEFVEDGEVEHQRAGLGIDPRRGPCGAVLLAPGPLAQAIAATANLDAVSTVGVDLIGERLLAEVGRTAAIRID